MKVAVVGSREIDDDKLVERIVRRIFARWPEATIVSGGARGVDTLAAEAARRFGHEPTVMPAAWQELGRGAGHVRNRAMAETADAVVAVWDGRSRGTANMLCVSMELGRRVWLYVEPRRAWITTYEGIRSALGFTWPAAEPESAPGPEGPRQLSLGAQLSPEDRHRADMARADERWRQRERVARRTRRW